MPKPPACPDKVNVLLIGGGGREHALGWKLKKSGRLGKLWIDAAKHGGLARSENAARSSTAGPFHEKSNDLFQLRNWCDENNIQLVVVGPEIPLPMAFTMPWPAKQDWSSDRLQTALGSRPTKPSPNN